MSPMPEGWSVDVEGTQVVVRVSGRPDDRFVLSAGEAWTLKNQLHLAHLTARRLPRAPVDPDQLEQEIRRGPDAQAGAVEATDAPEESVKHEMQTRGVHSDLNPWPLGWSVEVVGRWVFVEVPASAVDGVFQLTYAEAMFAGVALIRGSERARMGDDTLDEEHDEDAEFWRAIELLRSINSQRETEFARDAHRQSALAAGSAAAAEDQAWVDSISEFGEGSESEPDEIQPTEVLPRGGYEIREARDLAGRRSIEAWLSSGDWPVVRAVAHDDRWLVLLAPQVAQAAGNEWAVPPVAQVIGADRAREWVDMLATLYANATGYRALIMNEEDRNKPESRGRRVESNDGDQE